MVRPGRSNPKIDYKVFHQTGKKVAKLDAQYMRLANRLDKDTVMERNQLVDENEMISIEIEDFFQEYNLEEIYDVEDIEKCILELKALKKKYEGVHVKLRRVLDEEYDESYKDYDSVVKKMVEWIKEARKEISRRKKEKDEKQEIELVRQNEILARKENEEREKRNLEREELVRKEKEAKEMRMREEEKLAKRDVEERKELAIKEQVKVKAEEKYFKIRLEQFLRNLEDDSEFIVDIEKNISELKYFIEIYSELHTRIVLLNGEDKKDEFESEFRETLDNVNQWIQHEKRKIKMVRQAEKEKEVQEIELAKSKELSDKERQLEKVLQEREESEKMYAKKVTLVSYLSEEIRSSVKSLVKKYSVPIKNLSDSELLDKRGDIKLMEVEFNEVLNKVTELVREVPSKYNEENKILETIYDDRDILRSKREKFIAEIEQEISNRDLSSEKMKNASLLKIELPRFKGYYSRMDIYTFQAEFEKLISPGIQKKLLPDYLKMNYLEGQAFLLVKEIQDLEQIWDKLKESFGSTGVLLKNKLSEVEKFGFIWKIRDREKLIPVLSKLVNALHDLKKLVQKHNIENELYHSSSLGIIYQLIGEMRVKKIKAENLDNKVNCKEEWSLIIKSLERELRLEEELLLHEKSMQQFSVKNSDSSRFNDSSGRKSYLGRRPLESDYVNCFICDKNDHVKTTTIRGRKVVNYIACEKFVKMKPSDRFKVLRDKKLCFQCLNPGLKVKHDGVCYDRYACKHDSHKKFNTSKHILVCEEHKDEPENLKLFEEYKTKFITSSKTKYEDFSKNLKLSFFVGGHVGKGSDVQLESSIYMLQTIRVEGKEFNLFFDSGCGDLVCRKSAVLSLQEMGRANCELKGPLMLAGVGDIKTVCEEGIYKVRIPMVDGNDANMSGLCLDKVTQEFPQYKLREVSEDIKTEFKKTRVNGKKQLPKLPKSVGGNTDLMIGIKYLKYFPKEVFQLPSGLTVYESVFRSADGSRGVIGGPHRIFAEIEKQLRGSHITMTAYFTEIVTAYRNSYRLTLDVPLLGMADDRYYEMIDSDCDDDGEQAAYCQEKRFLGDPVIHDCSGVVDKDVYMNRVLKSQKRFEEVEGAGTEILYRCVKCRDCKSCKTSEQIEYTSIQEEIEQDLINQCVTVDVKKGQTIARLPFIKDPVHRLSPNEHIALKIYKSQVRKLENSPTDKQEVINSEKKLHDLGFVEFFEELSNEQKSTILGSSVKYFIPWRAVWNRNSISTPCRLVFDASQKTNSDYSLNSLLAKGRNNMNRLVEIAIRWMIHRHAFHTDIQKMYNTIKLKEEHWCYQLYLWDDELNPLNEPKWKVIKTLIYGVRSSGNQAERGLRETANLMKDEFPRVNEVIRKDIYVDDCLSGENSVEKVRETTDSLKLVLNRGGFCLKGLTFSGMVPPDNLSSDGTSVNVAGMKWFSKEDKLALNIGELNFGKKKRGKKPIVVEGVIPDSFTRRDCVGKVAEMFDLLGKVTPLIAGMKLDLSELCNRKLSWDDVVPDDLKWVWRSNFEMMKEIKELRYNRTVIPENAVNLEIETIDTADASNSLVCAAIYARLKMKNGEYSCQLVFSRSKIVPKNMTMPRAELLAAVLNASTGHVVKVSFGKYFKKCTKVTDSQIVLHWISNRKLVMKQWVRSRVIEINRLTDPKDWRYVNSKDMVADLGTRKGAKIEDVLEGSPWINGYPWMRLEEKSFPTKSVEVIKLNAEELRSHDSECLSNECINSSSNSYPSKTLVPSDVGERYSFSNYVIDPNKFRLRKVVRILALVMLFIRNCKRKVGKRIKKTEITNRNIKSAFNFEHDQYIVTEGKSKSTKDAKFKCKDSLVVCLTENDIHEAMRYFYNKATLEIRHFLNPKAYNKISTEIDGILYYTGRILPSQEFSGKLSLCDASIDLCSTTFCVPLTDSLSPFGYSIVNETHWYNEDARHLGIETVLRYSQKIAYIIEGRGLVKKFRKNCPRCRKLELKAIEVTMGPVHSDSLNIAPAFFVSQVDLFGPVNSYSNINKRATVKIWFVIFCCCVTGAIDLKVMEDYSTESFLLGFMRFACKVGYPKKLMPDEGSQLVKGCNVVKLEFYDIKHKLNERYGVEFETCPAGAHYMHGKVERKIRHVQESFTKSAENSRLSIIQWETLGAQVANSVNNQPIAIGNIVEDVENLDILTPNRLILGRNNDRCPTGSLVVTDDPKRIIKANNDIFKTWFNCWLISCVPKLTHQPKWFKSDHDIKIGDVVLFLKSDKEFDKQYQYGMVKEAKLGKDYKIRSIDIEYRNHNEGVNRCTRRGTRDIVVIHPVDEIGISAELGIISTKN